MDTQDQFQNPNQNPPVVSLGDWFVTMFITAIPLIGLIMLFVWSFGGGVNPNKTTWAKAALIWAAIATVIYILVFVLFGFAFWRGFHGDNSYMF